MAILQYISHSIGKDFLQMCMHGLMGVINHLQLSSKLGKTIYEKLKTCTEQEILEFDKFGYCSA